MSYLLAMLNEVRGQNFKVNLEKLEALCRASGVPKADFSHILASTNSAEGLAHRREIVAAILTAKGMKVTDHDLQASAEIPRFINYIQTMVDITRSQEQAQAAAALAPSDDEREAMIALQSLFNRTGESFRIDYRRAFADGADAVAYRIAVHRKMVGLITDTAEPRGVNEEQLRRQYADRGEFVQQVKTFVSSFQLGL